jgi:hypothetical protein
MSSGIRPEGGWRLWNPMIPHSTLLILILILVLILLLRLRWIVQIIRMSRIHDLEKNQSDGRLGARNFWKGMLWDMPRGKSEEL